MAYEVEYIEYIDEKLNPVKLGFFTLGGFNPYRYEYREDAEWCGYLLKPQYTIRIVPAKSVIQEERNH